MSGQRARIVFMGSPEFAVPSLRAIVAAGHTIAAVYTQPDRPAGRGRRLIPPAVKVAAEKLGIAVHQPSSLRNKTVVDELRALAPDLIVVAAYGQILRPAVIEIPRHGVLNVHASLLPRHRGAAPIPAAILAGDAETGVSIMQIDQGLDTGPVLGRRTTPIEYDDSTATLTARLEQLGAELLVASLAGWLDGSLAAVPQDDSLATLARPLHKDAGQIDWRKPAVTLWREVRAYNPWPLSSTRLGPNDEQLQVLEARALPAVSDSAAPAGTVVAIADRRDQLPPEKRGMAAFGVATGDGFLVPLLVRRAGRNATTAADFARGARGLIGTQLPSERRTLPLV
jgi:methionyl-tRNA formyltransferase